MPAMGAGHSARQVFDLPEPTPLVVPIASMIAGAPAAGRAALVGPSGIGNPTLAQNIAHQAVIHGHTVLFTTAGQLLGNLAAPDSDSTLRRRLHHYVKLTLLVIDEVGYLSYSNRHADLLFELISRRFENKATRPIQGERKRGSRGFGPEWLA